MSRFRYPPGAIVALRNSPVADGYQPFMVSGHLHLEEGDFYQLRELCMDGTTFIIGTLFPETELTTDGAP